MSSLDFLSPPPSVRLISNTQRNVTGPAMFTPAVKEWHHNPKSRWYVFPRLHTSPCVVDRQRAKKYNTIVEGFKVLEANYEESERKLAAAEEQLSAVDTAYNTLTAQMEMSRQVLHDRDMVR